MGRPRATFCEKLYEFVFISAVGLWRKPRKNRGFAESVMFRRAFIEYFDQVGGFFEQHSTGSPGRVAEMQCVWSES